MSQDELGFALILIKTKNNVHKIFNQKEQTWYLEFEDRNGKRMTFFDFKEFFDYVGCNL